MDTAAESRGLRNDGRLAPYTVNARYAAFAGHRGISVRDLSLPDDCTYCIRYETGRPRFNAVLAFSPAKLNLLAVANGSQILIFDVAARKTRGTLRGNGRTVNSIAFAASEPNILVVGAVDGSFCVWSLEDSSRPLHHIRGLIGACSNVAVSPISVDRLAVCHKGKVSVWSLPGLRPIAVMKSKTPTLELLSWSPVVPTSIAGVSSSGVMTIWDVADALNAAKASSGPEKEDDDDGDDNAMFGEPDDVDSAPCSTLQLGYPVTQVQLLGQRGLVVLPCRGKALFFYAYSQETSDLTELWRLSLDATIECFALRELASTVKAAACLRMVIQDYNVPAPVLDGMGWSGTRSSFVQSPHTQAHSSPEGKPRSVPTMRPEPPQSRDRTMPRPFASSQLPSPVNIVDRNPASYDSSKFTARQHRSRFEASPARSLKSSLGLPSKPSVEKNRESIMPFLSPTIPARRTDALPPLDEPLHLSPLARASFDSMASSTTLENDSDSDDETFAGNMGNSVLLPGGVNVPLPRTCGASFSPSGQLCTFFPFRARPASLMEEVDVMDSGKVGTHISDATRLFPTFGNLAATLRSHDDAELADAAPFAEPASDAPQFVLQAASFESRPSWKAKVSPIKASSRPLPEEHSVYVAVRELGSLLPGRKALAVQYRLTSGINEKDTELCNDNADAAAGEDLSEVADAWRVLAMTVEQAPVLTTEPSMDWTHVAGNAEHRPALSRNISVLSERGDESDSADLQQQVLTDHPLGRAWALKKIFEWAEQKADVQTLACVSALTRRAIGRTATTSSLPISVVSPDVLTSRLLQLDATNMPPGVPPFHRQSLGLEMVEEHSHTPHISQASPRDSSLPPTPYLNSSMSTPPLSLSAGNRQAAKLFASGSASPEQHHRSSFGATAKYYAQTISDKLSSYGSSPPTRRAGTSPGNELSSSLPTATGSWSKSVSFASNLRAESSDQRRLVLAQEDDTYDSDKTIEDANLPQTPKMPANGVSYRTNREVAFFDELNPSSCSTFDKQQMATRGKLWCQSYSEQLRSWDLLVEAAELDNINNFTPSSGLSVGYSEARTICPEPVTGKARPMCVVCYCIIRGAEQLCPACLHTTHPRCLEQLLAGTGEEGLTCPTGCGCHCSEVSNLRLEVVDGFRDIAEPQTSRFKKKNSFTDPRRLRSKLQGESR